MYEFNFKSYDNSKQSISYCEVDKCKKIIELREQLEQLKGVIKKYEECNKYLVEENRKTYTRLEYKLLKTLTEIKEIAEKLTDDYGHKVSNVKIILQTIKEVIKDEE